jgi:hypothetical protein
MFFTFLADARWNDERQAKPAFGILVVMVSRAGLICSSGASIERGSAVRSGVLSLDQ